LSSASPYPNSVGLHVVGLRSCSAYIYADGSTGRLSCRPRANFPRLCTRMSACKNAIHVHTMQHSQCSYHLQQSVQRGADQMSTQACIRPLTEVKLTWQKAGGHISSNLQRLKVTLMIRTAVAVGTGACSAPEVDVPRTRSRIVNSGRAHGGQFSNGSVQKFCI
jgi:hypothetical protein